MKERGIKGAIRKIGIWNLAVFLLIGCLYTFKTDVKATSATLTFSTENKEVQVGDTFSVVIYLEANENVGAFQAVLSYDESLVTFVKGGNHVSGGDGTLTITDTDSDASTSRKYSVNFKAKAEGTCNFGTSDAPTVLNEDGNELSVSSNRLNVSITTTKTLSSNTNLTRLLISPGTLSEAYSNGVTEYSTEISYDDDMLFVVAEAEDLEASISIQGNENLEVGTNFVHVIVTAPSGKQKDVSIQVKRLGKDENEEAQEANKEESTTNDGVKVSKEDDTFTIQVGNTYTVMDLEDDDLIPSGYEKSEITIGTETIPAYINSNNQEDEFVLLYLKHGKDVSAFYKYDRVEKTIQRYESGFLTSDTDIMTKQSSSTVSMAVIIIMIIFVAVIILLSILLALVLMKRKSKKEDLWDDFDDKNDIDR